MYIFETAKDWVMDRLPERTSHDGVLLIVICGCVLLFGGVAKLLAWVGLGYGIYTLIRQEG
jgi:hypothetical protein